MPKAVSMTARPKPKTMRKGTVEEPTEPDLVVETAKGTPEKSVSQLIGALKTEADFSTLSPFTSSSSP
jgi:hypothetical protein